MRLIRLAMVLALIAIPTGAYAQADNDDVQSAQEASQAWKHCLAAWNADNYINVTVYCGQTAESIDALAGDMHGEMYYGYRALEASALTRAAVGNWRTDDHEKARDQFTLAHRIAKAVLASDSADAADRANAKWALGQMKVFGY